jgi:putative lipoic acid-binding regulatory protein
MTGGSLLGQFPGEYTFKIFGRRSETFAERVRAIVSATFGEVPADAVRVRQSSAGRYVSVTIVLWVDDRAQLERVYTDLRADPEVLLYI